jgi:succinate dehydrogenase / fumarate reductase flavoprotein subunit
LFVLGEANFSEHGANRLGASALMQGLADGYFIAPATVPAWLAGAPQPEVGAEHPACLEALAAVRARLRALAAPPGKASSGRGAPPVDAFHRELGLLMIEACGISRSGPSLRQALADVEALRQRFAEEGGVADVTSGGGADSGRDKGSGRGEGSGRGKGSGGLNVELEKALRLEDFFGLADLMLRDALAREESCGAHFREEHQTAEGEALRDDARFSHIAAWEFAGEDGPRRHSEPLTYTALTPTARSYR